MRMEIMVITRYIYIHTPPSHVREYKQRSIYHRVPTVNPYNGLCIVIFKTTERIATNFSELRWEISYSYIVAAYNYDHLHNEIIKS